MDEDRVRDLIKDVARHGESITINTSGNDLRNRGAGTSSESLPAPVRGRRGLTVLRPFGHAAAIAWFVGIVSGFDCQPLA